MLYLGDAEGSRPLAPLGDLVDLVFPGGGHQAHRVLDDAGVAVPVAHVEGVRVLAHGHRRRLAVVPGKIENKINTMWKTANRELRVKIYYISAHV